MRYKFRERSSATIQLRLTKGIDLTVSQAINMFSALVSIPDVPVAGVNIWSAHLDSFSSTEIEELSSSLDQAELARAGRFHFEADRKHYIVSHGLIRRLLGAALALPGQRLAFQYGAHGKPALAPEFIGMRPLHFSISHSADWAMFALSWEREIGIDLESIFRLKSSATNLSSLALRVLSPREMAIWETLPDTEEREAAFLRAWTRKEAYAKAKGEGIFANLTTVEVILDAAAPTSSLVLLSPTQESESQSWVVHDLATPNEFAAALAVLQK